MPSTYVEKGKKRAHRIENDPAATDEEIDPNASDELRAAKLRPKLPEYTQFRFFEAPKRLSRTKQGSLADAILRGNKAQVKELIDNGADVEKVSSDIADAFITAVTNGDTDIVKFLLEAGVDANQKEEQFGSVLAERCYNGDLIISGLLIDAGAQVDLQLELGPYGNAFGAACLGGHAESVAYLIERGADVNVEMRLDADSFGTALEWACWELNIDLMELLLKKGADVNRPTKDKYGSVLAYTCTERPTGRRTEAVEVLLSNGANVNMQLRNGMFGSALAAASYCGNGEIAELLLRRGASVDLQLEYGTFGSALAAASCSGKVSMAKFLLRRGAKVNLQLKYGIFGSALAAASYSGDHGIAKLLIRMGARINLQLYYGTFGSALAAAIASQRLQPLRLLLRKGADLSLSLRSGLFGDAISRALDMETVYLTLLLAQGASIGPLAEAALKKAARIPTRFPDNILEELERRGIDINKYDEEPAQKTYEWLPPITMSVEQDNATWLSDFGILIKHLDVVEFDALHHFIEVTYGQLGSNLVLGLARAASHEHCYVDGYIRLNVLSRNLEDEEKEDRDLESDSTRGMIVSLETTSAELFEVMELICLGVRTPSIGSICVSTSVWSLSPKTRKMEMKLNKLLPSSNSQKDNTCWYGLFDSAVIALQPETTQQTPCRGLVLDFVTMLGLSVVEYPILVGSGIILMGYSTALIPIRETGDGMILWHLEIAQDDLQLKVANLQATRSKWLQTESLDYLKSKKALLGWCSKADILLGTRGLNPQVTWSTARNKSVTWRWKGANLQAVFQTASPVQIGFQAGGSFERMSNRLRFDPSAMYLKCLRSSTLEQVVLYDVNARRAWLVPLLSVLHHMLLVYVRSVEQESLVSNAPMADSPFDGTGSLKALRESGDMVIEESGNHTLTVAQLIMKFSINMSRLSPQKPRRSTIYGYEFMDIVMDSTRSELKKEHLQREGLVWLSLLGEVNCLFCSGIGEAIVGDRALETTSACNRLPKGNDFLAASMRSIETLSTRHGGSDQTDFRRLSQGHFWQLTGSPFKRCSHANHHDSCWDYPEFLQEIQTRQSSSRANGQNIDNCTNGALVFGSPLNPRPAEQASVPLTFLQGNTARGDSRVFQLPQVSDM